VSVHSFIVHVFHPSSMLHPCFSSMFFIHASSIHHPCFIHVFHPSSMLHPCISSMIFIHASSMYFIHDFHPCFIHASSMLLPVVLFNVLFHGACNACRLIDSDSPVSTGIGCFFSTL